ncbi:MAG TPA: M1 family metallopeptidase [Longimicrobiaceae bacterium]|nr:M1 family metallopeptidase [Longimicrobiaceae bacterium]
MQRTPALLAVLALLGTACVPGRRPASGPEAESSDTATRHLVRPVPLTPSFRDAVQRGTRTLAGAPGSRYWQQRVSYRIEAELDPRTATLRGRERIVYRNHSPVPLRALVLHLYQNLFREGVPRNRFAPITGGVTLERVAAAGQPLAERPLAQIPVLTLPEPGAPVGYAVQGTLARLILPRAVVPGDSAVLEIDWSFHVPPSGTFRTAWQDTLGGRAFQVAQWYPQVAVFDDVRGWDATPYLGEGEFYLEYGDFEVALTLPAGWLVGATGTLRNPQEVLPAEALRRLAAAAGSDSVTRVVSEADAASGRATLPGRDGRLTWRFYARDVRDFAFAASDRYVWDAVRADVPAGEGADTTASRGVLVHALYRPGAPGWGEAARHAQRSLEGFSRLLVPYGYGQLTLAEGSVGAMEYPQILFIGKPDSERRLFGSIAHEVAHQWFPMMVGQDEAAFAWMDEGITEYHESLAVAERFPEGPDPFLEDLASYLAVAGSEREVPLMRHIDLVAPHGEPGVAAYRKPATLFRSLRGIVGDSVYWQALRTYAREWRFRHPYPWDLFHTVERVAGRDLDWFWYPWWWETGTLDYAIGGVEAGEGGSVRITLRDLGDIPAPIAVVVTAEGGAVSRAEIPIELWTVDRLRTATLALPVYGAPLRVEIDPEHLFPDVNPENNVWVAPGAQPR